MATLTYADSAALMVNDAFIQRIKVACLNYSVFIYNEAITVQGHPSRLRWAQGTMQTPDAVAGSIAPSVVMDPNVQAAGSAITDAALQTAVEATINKIV